MEITIGADALGEEGEAELTEWLAEDGATVAEGDVIAEIETAKALVEVNAPAAGTLRRVAAAGDMVAADTVIGRITDA